MNASNPLFTCCAITLISVSAVLGMISAENSTYTVSNGARTEIVGVMGWAGGASGNDDIEEPHPVEGSAMQFEPGTYFTG